MNKIKSNGNLRILSGLIVGILCIGLAVYSTPTLLLLIGLIWALSIWELNRMYFLSLGRSNVLLVVLPILGGLAGYVLPLIYILSVLVLPVLLLVIIDMYGKWVDWSENRHILFSLVYPGACLGILAQTIATLSEEPGKAMLLFFTFIWASDVGAYYFGRKYGKHKLMEYLSPNKTLEGFFGGGLATLLVSLGWYCTDGTHSLFVSVVMAVIVWSTSSYGDLAESRIKRFFKQKDSSQLIPGHGGIFDRFDGFIFAAPFYSFLLIIEQYI